MFAITAAASYFGVGAAGTSGATAAGAAAAASVGSMAAVGSPAVPAALAAAETVSAAGTFGSVTGGFNWFTGISAALSDVSIVGSLVQSSYMAELAEAESEFKARELEHEMVLRGAEAAEGSRDKVKQLQKILAANDAMQWGRGISLSSGRAADDNLYEYSRSIGIDEANVMIGNAALSRTAQFTRASGAMEAGSYRTSGIVSGVRTAYNLFDRYANRGSVPRLNAQ